MSITKRNFLIIFSIVLVFSFIFSVFSWTMIHTTLTNQLLSSQQALASSNSNLSRLFTENVNNLIYQYTSDERLGQLLSSSVGEDSLTDIQIKSALHERLSYHLNSQARLLNNQFTPVLYINPELEVHQLFTQGNSVVRVSKLLSGTLVEDEPWYQNTLNLNHGTYLFVSEDGQSLCIARKLYNSAFPCAHLKNGVGILLGRLPLERFPKIIGFDPITENSGFALLDSTGKVLYRSSALNDTFPHQITSLNISDGRSDINGIDYLYTSKKLDWSLTLLYLTPYSDIRNRVYTTLIPFIGIIVLFLLLCLPVSLVLSRRLSHSVVKLAQNIEKITDTRKVDPACFDEQSSLEIQQLNNSFLGLIGRINALIDQVKSTERAQKESELRALQAQINPHFILNAMNAVNYLALMRGMDDIASTIDCIANLMRYSITEPDQMVLMDTEVENLQNYISIYILRFRQDIQLKIVVDCPHSKILIPKFTLQPLVENSIRHGITREDPGITILIHAWEDSLYLYVDVTDTGHGADADMLNAYLHYEAVDLKVTHGFGIRNVNERMQLRFGNSSGLSYSYNEKGQLLARLSIDKTALQNTDPSIIV